MQVEVTKTKIVLDRSVTLKALFTMENQDFLVETGRMMQISWSSTRSVLLFSIMKASTWNALYQALVLEFGLFIAVAIITGGSLTPVVLAALPAFIVSTATTILTSGDYYRTSSAGEVATKYLEPSLYKLVIIDVSDSGGSLNAEVPYEYNTMETQTRYRTETRYREEIEYYDETRYRTEEQSVEEPLLAMPRFKGIEWNVLGYATFLSGIMALVAGIIMGKKHS